jgi:transcriptional regulator with XRE-family HTH domain
MVTRKKPAARRLYLKEHREAKGLSASQMGEKLNIERESVYRLEKKFWGVSSEKQAAYAAALGLEPQELWYPPGSPSLDAIVSRAPLEVQESVQTLIRRLIPDSE